MDGTHESEVRREASVMALYVAVCLLAALIALGEDAGHGHVRAFGLVWGTTIGLALAHAFAFRVSARLSAQGRFDAHDARIVGAQLGGAAFVAVICSVPVLFVGATGEFDVVRTVLSVFIGAMGYEVARLGGADRMRAVVYGVAVLALAVVVAVVKNVLSGH